MRALAIICFALAAIAGGLWVFGYIYISALACAFSGPSGSQNCTVKPPWALAGEDLVFMVLMPGGVVVGIFLLGLWANRKAQYSG